MASEKHGWEDEEQTIVSFPPVTPLQEERAQQVKASAEDGDETIVGQSSELSAPVDENRTVVADSNRQPREIEGMAWLAMTKTPSVRRGQVFTLDKVRSDIGRGAAVTIFLNDK